MALTIAGCASPDMTSPSSHVDLPLAVGNGIGSQHGNYAAEEAGETRGPDGERCILFNWDRPLTPDLAIRYRSMSCESKERLGWMVVRDLGRLIIPIGESNLKDAGSDPTE